MPDKQPNADVLRHVERLMPKVQEIQKETNDHVKKILKLVLTDEVIANEFKEAKIRLTSMRGEVVKQILQQIGGDTSRISLMAIGDVFTPDFMEETLEAAVIDRTAECHREIEQKLGYGYDIPAKGHIRARKSAINLFDKFYGFSEQEGLKEKLVENSTIIPGGMQALTVIATTLIGEAVKNKKRQRFISPDNTFGTWHSILKKVTYDGLSADDYTIDTEPKDLLHLTPEKVHAFYAENGKKNTSDAWYIIPVSNPSGTMIKPEQLSQTCEAIIEENPEAVIILDIVYVRTLGVETARKLMSVIVNNEKILNRVVFIESFSKTHGIPGERAGLFFTSNKSIYDPIQNTDMTLFAGHGHDKSALVMALTEESDLTEELNKELLKWHEFWRCERLGLYHYLIKNGKFDHLFDSNQEHIIDEQWETPMGLYLFVKLKEGVAVEDVILETGCFGVEEEFKSGKYIRFSVGRITQPTYSKYINLPS